MIKSFIFDVGKVIVPFELDNGIKLIANCCDLSSTDIRGKIFGSREILLFESGKISANEFFDSVKTSINLRMDFDEFVSAWNSIFIFEPIISDDLIKSLSKDYRLIILSDTNEIHFSFIKQRFPIMRYFGDFVLSHEVGFLKPAPEIFQAAIEKAECLPEECFFTDDKKDNVDGAIGFGINAVQFFSADQFETELQQRNLIK
jgi:putative hydrolase of the HAD superfamily